MNKKQAIEFAKDRIEILNKMIPENESESKIQKETLSFLFFVKDYMEKESKI